MTKTLPPYTHVILANNKWLSSVCSAEDANIVAGRALRLMKSKPVVQVVTIETARQMGVTDGRGELVKA